MTSDLLDKQDSRSRQERAGAITFKGNPKTLVGPELQQDAPAPAFTAVANDLSDATLEDYKGKVVVISSVPSLDTGICDLQTRRFNEEAGKLGDGVIVLTISMDLPFAQKRWCGAAGLDHVITLSDYKYRSFGQAYGLYMKELGLLARAVLVIDDEGIIRHYQLVAEMTHEPDYDSALDAVTSLV